MENNSLQSRNRCTPDQNNKTVSLQPHHENWQHVQYHLYFEGRVWGAETMTELCLQRNWILGQSKRGGKKELQVCFPFLFCSLACFRLKKTNQNLWKEWWDVSVPAGLDLPQKVRLKDRSSNPQSMKFNGMRSQDRLPSWPWCSISVSLSARSATISPTNPGSLEDALYF